MSFDPLQFLFKSPRSSLLNLVSFNLFLIESFSVFSIIGCFVYETFSSLLSHCINIHGFKTICLGSFILHPFPVFWTLVLSRVVQQVLRSLFWNLPLSVKRFIYLMDSTMTCMLVELRPTFISQMCLLDFYPWLSQIPQAQFVEDWSLCSISSSPVCSFVQWTSREPPFQDKLRHSFGFHFLLHIISN